MNKEFVNDIKSLTRQTKSVRLVVNFPIRDDGTYNLKSFDLNQFKEDLNASLFLFAFILHDKDLDENGVLKTPHLHIFLMSDKRHQLKFYLYQISDLLHCSENLISVRVSTSDAGALQYLIHKNEPNKFHYDIKNIVHNFNDELFESLMSAKVVETLTSHELIKLCNEHNKLDLIEILGPMRYNAYSKVINEIYKELRYLRLRDKLTYTKYIDTNSN